MLMLTNVFAVWCSTSRCRTLQSRACGRVNQHTSFCTTQGGNPKAVAAKERKADAKERDKVQKEKAAEDAAWAAAGDGAKSKAQAKKEEQVRIVGKRVSMVMVSSFRASTLQVIPCKRAGQATRRGCCKEG